MKRCPLVPVKQSVLFPIILLVLTAATTAWCYDLSGFSFKWRNPYPQGNAIYQLAFSGGRFLSLGMPSACMRTEDGGETWAPLELASQKTSFSSLCAGPDKLIAIQSGSSNVYYSLDNGLNWQKYPVELPSHCERNITYAKGLYIAGGDTGTMIYSYDGLNWEEGTTIERVVMSIAYGNSIWVAVTGGMMTDGRILTSKNGKDWIVLPDRGYSAFTTVFFDGAKFIASDLEGTWLSTDGTHWKRGWTGWNFNQIVKNGGLYVGAAYNGIYTSTDGVKWTKRLATVQMHSAAYGDGLFMVAGEYGEIYTSKNGTRWTIKKRTAGGGEVERIVWGDAGYVAISSYRIISSPDGLVWNEGKIDKPGYEFSPFLRGLGFGAGKYIVGALMYPVSRPWQQKGVMLVSTDGLNWDIKASPEDCAFQSIAYGNGTFVGCGWVRKTNGDQFFNIYTSTDGLKWTKRSSGGSPDLIFAKGLFILPREYEQAVYYSKNGIKWTKKPTGELGQVQNVAWNGTTFVGANSRGDLYSSMDRVNWTLRRKAKTYDGETGNASLTWGGGMFMAVFELAEKGSYNPTYCVSKDGITWKSYTLPVPLERLWDVVFARDRFTVTGSHGLVMQSPEIR